MVRLARIFHIQGLLISTAASAGFSPVQQSAVIRDTIREFPKGIRANDYLEPADVGSTLGEADCKR